MFAAGMLLASLQLSASTGTPQRKKTTKSKATTVVATPNPDVLVEDTIAVDDTISLDEKWLFHLSKTEAGVPRGVETTAFNDHQWHFQSIPGTWNVLPSWRNSSYVGVYRGWIKLQRGYHGKRLFLHVGTTTAVTDVYLNGALLGKTAADRAQTEFEITNRVTLGERNLFVFRMPRFNAGENVANTRGKSGITTDCFIYALDSLAAPAAPFTPKKARRKVKVSMRESFEPERGFMDSPTLMLTDLKRMKQLGFGAVTCGKLTTDPRFIALAKQEGIDIVSNRPDMTGTFIDETGKYTPDGLACIAVGKYDFDAERKAAEARAGKNTGAPRVTEDGDQLTISGKGYHVAFDKTYGYIDDYVVKNVPIIAGALMPNAKTTLVSLTEEKNSASSGTKVVAVYNIGGEQARWTYTIKPNGVLNVKAESAHDIKVAFAQKLTERSLMAPGPNGLETVKELKVRRPNVLWLKQTNSKGRGVELVGDASFSAVPTNQSNVLLLRHGGEDFELTLCPIL